MSLRDTSRLSLLGLLWLGGACCGDVDSMPIDAGGAIDTPGATPDATPDAPAATWNLTEVVPGTTNPNAPWAYGWAPSLGGSLTLFTMLTTDLEHQGWIDPANVVLATPQIWRNRGAAPIAGVPVGAVSMHPGQGGEYAVARFTAPTAGRYRATLQAFDGASGVTDATVRVDGAFGTTVTVDGSNPTLTVPATTLAAGDAIELWIGPAGDGSDDNTPVTFVVSTAP